MVDDTNGGVPLRLYLKLEQGHVADLFAVTEATAAFGAGVRELAYLLDPSLQLYIGLAPSSPGSLWENTVLKAIDDPAKRKQLYLLAGSALLWFVAPPAERIRDNMWAPYIDRYLPPPGTPEREKDLETMRRVGNPRNAAEEHRQVFRALGRDTSITAAGVSIEQTTPKLLVPQSDFAARAGFAQLTVYEDDRVATAVVRATLVRPVLEPTPRRWKFRTGQGDLSATMKDQRFLDAVAKGSTGVPLRAGIEMELLLETRERFTNGVWQIIDRNVIEVLDIGAPPEERQTSMFPE